MQPSSAHSTFLAGVAAGVAAAAGTARLVAVLRQAYYKRQRAAAKATKAAKLAARANARAAAKAKAANAKAAAGTAAAEAEQAKAACAESKGKCKRETRPPTGSEFPEYTLVDAQDLRTFAEDCLKHAGCARENAEVVADVLLSGGGGTRDSSSSLSRSRLIFEAFLLTAFSACTSTATKFDLAL
eukprot:INCI4845.2.p2 GENE.INCI4845.2~~INCI4845.2.p2  ORF type:complete len:185 (+),score=40.14 INCI4845.2:140-694(+)